MGILGFSEILEVQEENEFKKETLGYIRQSAQRLLDWMNEIIDDISSNDSEVGQYLPIDIKELLFDLTQLMRARIELKKLKWSTCIDPTVPQNIVGDLGGLRRILLNLVGNAVKFTDEGEISIVVNNVSQIEDEVVLELIVKDTGIGIPESNYNDIFKKYSRLAPTNLTRYSGGGGLGLYNVTQILERLGGSVVVNSVFGQGSEFTCRLPFKLKLECAVSCEA